MVCLIRLFSEGAPTKRSSTYSSSFKGLCIIYQAGIVFPGELVGVQQCARQPLQQGSHPALFAVALGARVLQLGVVVLVVVPVCCPSVLDQVCWVQGSECAVSGPDARTFLFHVMHTTQPEVGGVVLEGQRL